MNKRIYYPPKQKRKGKKRRHKEHNHQKAVFELAKIYESRIPELKLLRGSMEGVNLDPRTARWMKDAGVKPGFPDIHWPIARGHWFSIYIELKTDEGHATPKQLEVAAMLRAQGNLVLFIVGSQPAWDALMRYYSMPPLHIRKAEKKGNPPKIETRADADPAPAQA